MAITSAVCNSFKTESFKKLITQFYGIMVETLLN